MTRCTRSHVMLLAFAPLPLSVSAHDPGTVTDASALSSWRDGRSLEPSALIEQTRGGHQRGRPLQHRQPAAGTYAVTFTLSGFKSVRAKASSSPATSWPR